MNHATLANGTYTEKGALAFKPKIETGHKGFEFGMDPRIISTEEEVAQKAKMQSAMLRFRPLGRELSELSIMVVSMACFPGKKNLPG